MLFLKVSILSSLRTWFSIDVFKHVVFEFVVDQL
jgi:hypothetical protein